MRAKKMGERKANEGRFSLEEKVGGCQQRTEVKEEAYSVG